jgi:hypothetical protein
MKTIVENKFFEEYKKCEYYACNKDFLLNRKDKRFCCRECKNSNRKMKNYFKNKKRKE